MASIVRVDLKEVVRHFKQLEDPRSVVNRLHPLESVIVIAIMAVLAGANGPTAIAKWAMMKSAILLKLLDLPHGIPRKDVFRRVLVTLKPDAIITIDAMGTQTAIAEKIIDDGGDYILALKGNQGTLHDAVIDYISEQTKTDFRGIGARRLDTAEKKHGRIESRTYVQMPAPKSLPGFNNWKGLLSIGIAFLWSVRDGKETAEVRYFISSLHVKVKQFAHAVRSRWGIENSCHWCLDVTYREDESRIRDEHLRENFAWLNRLTLSLLKQYPDKDSVAMKRRACGWNDEHMLQVLTGTKG